MKFRLPFQPSTEKGLGFTQPSMTMSEFAPDCDVNNIVARYIRTGVIDHVKRNLAQYGDVSQLTSYSAALDCVSRAEELFDALPAKLRDKLQNDPGRLLDYLSDSANADEARGFGLLNTTPSSDGDAKASTVEPSTP